MDIKKYINSIEIPTENEEQLKDFLAQKEEAIKASILKHWEEHTSANKAVSESTPLLEEEETKHSKIDEIRAINQNVPFEITIPETDDLPLESISEPSAAASEEVSNAPESIQKLPEQTMSSKANEVFELQIKNKSIILPNGKANQAYKFIFKIEELGLSEISDYWFDGLEKIGLAFNSDTNEISGIPTLAGDHKIVLKIKLKDWTEGKPIIPKEITLIINPDPKTLWKNIPTPTDVPYYKPDSNKRFVKVEAYKGILGIGRSERKDMVAASQRGRSHAQEGKPRDDDFGLHYMAENNWYIMTVADGAGSAVSSRKGSEIACKTVVEVCEHLIKAQHKEFEHLIKEFSSDKSDEKRKKMGDSLYGIVGNAVFKALKNIEEEAKTNNKPVKDFSTTLIVSICKKFKFGWFVGAFWVGDGGIGIYNKETRFLKVLGESDGGEFAGQTRFLTMPEITQPAELYRRLRFEIVDDFTALILMTDGVTDPKFETDSNLLKVEKWDALWNDLSKEVVFSDDNAATADQLLGWLDFWSPGNHDDRTIAILF